MSTKEYSIHDQTKERNCVKKENLNGSLCYLLLEHQDYSIQSFTPLQQIDESLTSSNLFKTNSNRQVVRKKETVIRRAFCLKAKFSHEV